MRSPPRIVRSSALASALVACIPWIASAEPVTVIRGSQRSVVDAREGDAREARHVVVPAALPARSIEPAAAAPVAPVHRVVLVDVRALPELAWEMVNPWEESGIKVHRMASRHPSRIRVHGAGRPSR
jgi:hypothetical protein